MRSIGVVLLLCLCHSAVTSAKWQLPPVLQSLDSDLDSLLCSPTSFPATIIDIHESMEKGAELLDGKWSHSLSECSAGCCQTRGCDLALFKNEGASKSGKNCYYVHCGELSNCVMVEHSAFTSIAFTTGTQRQGHTPSLSTSNVPATHPSTTPSQPQPSETPPTPSASPSPISAESDQDQDHVIASTSTLQPPPSTDHKTTPSSSSKEKSKEPSKEGSSGMKKTQSKPKNIDDAKLNNECGQYGCDGSGVVAVVVVGVVCFVIVLVVVAILLKKVVDERRKKKFRNVDYLINGMYT